MLKEEVAHLVKMQVRPGESRTFRQIRDFLPRALLGIKIRTAMDYLCSLDEFEEVVAGRWRRKK